jgi:tRNA dimethylallyltransferase
LEKQLPTKPRAIFLMGPTASGKTDLALALHRQLPVEIINVDSAQIYRGMNIGTAKPDANVLATAPHRLISFCDPAQPYSAAQFARDAQREMAEIVASNKVPLLVGGTMLYFKVLLEGMAELPEADAQIRDEIQQQAQREGWPSLHRELEAVDPLTASRLHPNHSQRIQRALEVYRITGKALSELQNQTQIGIESLYDIKQFALIPNDRHRLHQNIEARFHAMIEEGLEAEVKTLYQRGDLTKTMPAIRSVGYRQLWDYFEGHCSLNQAIERAVIATRQLAKRQLTWLKSWPNTQQINIDNEIGFCDTDDLCQSLLKTL